MTEYVDNPETIRRAQIAKGLAEIEVILRDIDPITLGLVKDTFKKRIKYAVENMAKLGYCGENVTILEEEEV